MNEFIATGISIAALIGTWLAVPQIQNWLKNREERLEPTTLGNLGSAKQYDGALAPGVVKADRSTLSALQRTLPSSDMQWLHEKDFAGAFGDESVKSVEHFAYSHTGPEDEFLDHELESMRLELKNLTKEFIWVLYQHTDSLNPGQDRQIRKIPDQYENDEYSDRLLFQKAKEINDAAESAWEKYQHLIRRGRLKLALSDSREED